MNSTTLRPRTCGQPYPYYQPPAARSFQHMLQQQADCRPDALAFAWKAGGQRQTRTFAQFQQDVLRVCAALQTMLKEGDHAALAAGNSYPWIVLFYALMLLGHPAAAINPQLPPEEVAAMAAQTDCTWMVQDGMAVLPEGIRCFSMDTVRSWMEPGQPMLDPSLLPVLDPERTCAFYFTSGTTGRPKAVMLSETNIISDINGSCALFEPQGSTVALLPFFHAFGLITGIFMPFHYGQASYISSSLRRMQADLQAEQPALVFMVPLMVETLAKRIARALKKAGASLDLAELMAQLPNLTPEQRTALAQQLAPVRSMLGGQLQHIICGGAFLDPLYVDLFQLAGIQILVGYGISECAPVASVNRNHFQKSGSAGQKIAGLEVRVGADQELLLKGPMVFQGYYQDPDATAQAMQEGWFHTGDLGWIDDDGMLFLSGRSKNLIILSSGENLSPESIEQDLLRMPGVEEVLVYAQDQKITAELYLDEAHGPDLNYARQVVSAWNDRQPMDHQIQQVRVREVSFEKNASQKIIRKTPGSQPA